MLTLARVQSVPAMMSSMVREIKLFNDTSKYRHDNEVAKYAAAEKNIVTQRVQTVWLQAGQPRLACEFALTESRFLQSWARNRKQWRELELLRQDERRYPFWFVGLARVHRRFSHA